MEQSLAARPINQPVVFYGSSSIHYWTTLADDLKSDRILNLAFGGSTLEACVFFFDRLVAAARPSSLVVYAGDNDLGDGRSPDQVVGYFRALARKVDSIGPGLPFGFISVKPSPARAGVMDRVVQTNRTISSDIAAIPGAYYIDVYTPMLGPENTLRPELFQSDGLHMNAAGYRLWTEILSGYRDRIIPQEHRSEHI
ncbi:MAG: GDSL-type esterase/lipase family protein [Capsulimonadaceae bacterium]